MECTASFTTLLSGFQCVFTAPSFQTFVCLMTGWVLSHRRRFVTDLIWSSGCTQWGHHSCYHRFFSHAAWTLDALCEVLAKLLVGVYAPTGLIELAVDDTLCRKRGLTVYGTGMHHDPLISSRAKPLTSWAQRHIEDVSNCHLSFVRIGKVVDLDAPIAPAVTAAQTGTDPPLRCFDIGVVAGVENVLLNVAVDRLDRVVVGAAFRKADPVQAKLAHRSPRLARLSRVGRVLVQHNPHLALGIPLADLSHEPAHMRRVLGGPEGPMDLSASDLVEQEEIELASRLLPQRKHQLLGRGVTSSSIGFHRDRLDIEKQQDTSSRQVSPNPANPGQNGLSLRIGADQLSPDATETNPPFFNNRRKCSRLIDFTIRFFIRCARRLANDQRPWGRPTSVGERSARRRISAT